MVLAVCVFCRPDGSRVWTTVVTWPTPGTKLYSVLAYVRYAPQGRQLLGTTCYFLSDVCKTDAIWGKEYLPFGNFAISIHSWPICLSTPALDRRLHLVPLVLWLCSFQLWCIVETIRVIYFRESTDIVRQCPQLMRGTQVTLLHCPFLALFRSAIPPSYLIPRLSMCVCRACHSRQQT